MAGLVDLLDNTFQLPRVEAYIGGRKVEPLSITIDHGFDSVNATATVELAEVPDWVQFRQQIYIRLGYGGYSVPAFSGFLEDDGRGYYPFTHTVKAVGYLRLAQYQYPSTLTYSSQNDTTIITDLLNKVGIDLWNIDGDALTLGAVKAVTLQAGTPAFELINRIDQVLGYYTFDVPSGVRRLKVSGIPAANVKHSYIQGTNIFSISRPRTTRGIHNKIIVTGLPQDSGTPSATWQADNPLVPTPPTYISYDFRSDLIETDELASTVGERLLSELNRIREEITLSVPGNPYLLPGDTVGVTSEKIGLSTEAPLWVQHVQHRVDSSGFVTTLTLVGGAGQDGYQVPGDGTAGVSPQASIQYRVDYETFDVGGVSTNMYTVDADGSASSDADSAPGTLTYAWSNDTNADTGTAATYATAFTAAELAVGPIITLAVTDADGNTDTVDVTIANDGNTPILQRELYVAARDQAEATSDGGANWNTWNPTALVTQTPEIAGADGSYFGTDGGELYFTDDFLATAPTLVEDFNSQINSIWVNEVDANRVSVGLVNGKVMRTLNASLLGSSTWTELYDFSSPIRHMVESVFNPGEYRISAGTTWYNTYDDFANLTTIYTWPTNAHRFALSNFSNYGCGEGGSPAVVREDGTAITFPVTVTDCRAITHHIRDDILYAAVLDGSDAVIYAKAAGATSFTEIGTITGAGQPRHMIRDGDSQQVIYLAADEGLYKTFDGGVTWKRMRDYAGAALLGNAVGYGSAPWQTITTVNLNSDTTANDAGIKVKSLWNGSSNDTPPSLWTNLDYDDSGWATAVGANFAGNAAPNYPIDAAPTALAIWETAGAANVNEECLIRHVFTLSNGIVSTVTLNLWCDDALVGAWVNGIALSLPAPVTSNGGKLYANVEVENTWLIAGGDNVIALWGENNNALFASLAYQLDLS